MDKMKLFLVMGSRLDPDGYDCFDECIGIFDTKILAEEAGTYWQKRQQFPDNTPYEISEFNLNKPEGFEFKDWSKKRTKQR